MLASLDHMTARALLEWQVELGADEAICETPQNRYEAPATQAKPKRTAQAGPGAAPAVPPPLAEPDPVEVAKQAAGAARDLAALESALGAFALCDLKRGAKKTVFSDGNPAARVMLIGEAPGRDEDRVGHPFVGRAGQLLDRMLEAIGMARTAEDPARAVYITNVIPWRPPQNRDPSPEEIAMMLPFLSKHVELVQPDLIVPMGNISCQALLGKRGITRLRGGWTEALGRPALPMFHPAYLLRNPHAKREAWADLLDLKARLESLP